MKSSTADAGEGGIVAADMGLARQHHGEYGYDGSFRNVSPGAQVTGVIGISAALFAGAGVALARGNRLAAVLGAASAVEVLATAGSYIYATRRGKFVVWERIFDELGLRGDETVLDLGCGRGAVLLAAAKRVPRGRAIGVDLWRADQTKNSQQSTLSNADLESVADRVEVRTADMTALPLPDESVDAIVSSLAIHNIATHEGRRKALQEAVRVTPAVDSRSPTSGKRTATPATYVDSAGTTCGGATSDGGCGMAAPGSQRAWSPRPSQADYRLRISS